MKAISPRNLVNDEITKEMGPALLIENYMSSTKIGEKSEESEQKMDDKVDFSIKYQND